MYSESTSGQKSLDEAHTYFTQGSNLVPHQRCIMRTAYQTLGDISRLKKTQPEGEFLWKSEIEKVGRTKDGRRGHLAGCMVPFHAS